MRYSNKVPNGDGMEENHVEMNEKEKRERVLSHWELQFHPGAAVQGGPIDDCAAVVIQSRAPITPQWILYD